MRLTSIFDNNKVVLLRKVQNRIHIGGLSVQMDWYNRGNNPLRSLLNQLPRFPINLAVALQVFAQFLRVHGVSIFMNVHEGDVQAGLGDSFCRCDKRIRYSHREASWLNPGSQQGEPQSIRPAVYSNTILSTAKLRKLALKLFHHRPTDKPGSLERLPHHR